MAMELKKRPPGCDPGALPTDLKRRGRVLGERLCAARYDARRAAGTQPWSVARERATCRATRCASSITRSHATAGFTAGRAGATARFGCLRRRNAWRFISPEA